MRVLVLPLVAASAIFFAHPKEPTEDQMRSAFRETLSQEVADLMSFVGSQPGGAEAVERVRSTGYDRFEIETFQKKSCQPTPAQPGFDCSFYVKVGLVDGPLQRELSGRFFNMPEGVRFVFEDEASEKNMRVASTQGEYIK